MRFLVCGLGMYEKLGQMLNMVTKHILPASILNHLFSSVNAGHVIGIGTVWTTTGVTGAEADNCPYLAARATAEYQAISGCTTAPVPIQQTGGSGTRCK